MNVKLTCDMYLQVIRINIIIIIIIIYILGHLKHTHV